MNFCWRNIPKIPSLITVGTYIEMKHVTQRCTFWRTDTGICEHWEWISHQRARVYSAFALIRAVDHPGFRFLFFSTKDCKQTVGNLRIRAKLNRASWATKAFSNMEARLSMRSVGSTASKRRRSTKVVRYSVKALSQFILISAGVFLAVSLW